MTGHASPAPRPPRGPEFFEFSGDRVAAAGSTGVLSDGWRLADAAHSWFYRAQNFAVGLTWLQEAEVLEQTDVPDEHAVLVLDQAPIRLVPAEAAAVEVEGPAFVVVPAGTSRIVGCTAGFVLRVFSSRATEVMARTFNNSTYAIPDPVVKGLPPLPPRGKPGAVQVYPMSDVQSDPTRFGRIFRTESLMVNWFEPTMGPRDTDHLTPHSHDDFEQASVTLAGEYVHHIRRPWTTRMRDWRPDEHVHVHSPSVTIIPPGNIHTTRAVGDGLHQLVDVFAPAREDFIERGCVLNQSVYDERSTTRESERR